LFFLGCGPLLEMGGELMVGDDDVLIDETAGGDVIDQPVEDGLITDLQQWLREVLGEWVEAGGVACGEDESGHGK